MGIFGDLTTSKGERGEIRPAPPKEDKKDRKPFVFPKDNSGTSPAETEKKSEK
ncbi:MAG: hypothetical protein V4486_03040 [Patescibacteria group bacterium]